MPAPAPETNAQPPTVARLAVGSEGFFQPGINLQGWIFVSRQDQTISTFRLRRAELRVKGEIIPQLFAYQVMIDPAKTLKFTDKAVTVDNQDPPPTDPNAPESVLVPTPPADTSILQDFFITLMTGVADVSLGQFKIPVSYEGSNSATKLLFPERALASRAFGDRRDLGLKAEKKFDYAGYVVGVYNGQGQNQLDSNNQKDLALRLEGYPMKGIVIAGVGYVGIGERNLPGTKDRIEGDIRVEYAHALLQGEYLHGWDVNATGTRVEGHGAYGVVGYTFAAVIQPLVRVGFLDPDVNNGNTTATNSEVNHYELGFNYYLRKDEVKFQLSYGIFDSALAGTNLRHEGTFSTQIAF